MIVYQDTGKELFMADYKPLPISLKQFSLSDLYELQNNIENAADNAFCNHSDLLLMALSMDLNKVNMFIRMKEKQARKEG